MGRKLLFCIQICTKRVDVNTWWKRKSELCCYGCTSAYLLKKVIKAKYFSPFVFFLFAHTVNVPLRSQMCSAYCCCAWMSELRCAEWRAESDTRRLLSHSSAEGGKFLRAHLFKSELKSSVTHQNVSDKCVQSISFLLKHSQRWHFLKDWNLHCLLAQSSSLPLMMNCCISWRITNICRSVE